MYTGRQLKNEAVSKVSRQIECGGVRQRVKFEDGRNNLLSKINQRKVLHTYVGTNILYHNVVQKEDGYLDELRNTNMQGGEIEAHAICSKCKRTVRIYHELSNEPNAYITVGGGALVEDYYLYYNRKENRYCVINKDMEIQEIQEKQENQEIQDIPVSDGGNCMFESLGYVLAKDRDKYKENPNKNIPILKDAAAEWLKLPEQEFLLNLLKQEYVESHQEKKERLCFAEYKCISEFFDKYSRTTYKIDGYLLKDAGAKVVNIKQVVANLSSHYNLNLNSSTQKRVVEFLSGLYEKIPEKSPAKDVSAIAKTEYDEIVSTGTEADRAGGMSETECEKIANYFHWKKIEKATKFSCTDKPHTPKGNLYIDSNGIYFGADNIGHAGFGFKVWEKGTSKNELLYRGNYVIRNHQWIYDDRNTKGTKTPQNRGV